MWKDVCIKLGDFICENISYIFVWILCMRVYYEIFNNVGVFIVLGVWVVLMIE